MNLARRGAVLRPRRRRLVLSATLAGLATGSTRFAFGQTSAARVVSVGGGITEFVYALGAQQLLIATDTTSLYPEAALRTPKVGYMRSLSAEGILALRPTVLLASHEAGPPAVLRQIESAGVRLVRTSERYDFEGVIERLTQVGDALGRGPQAAQLGARLTNDWRTTREQVDALKRSTRAPRVIFILSHAGAPMVAGRDTAADAMLSLAGAHNTLASAFPGYRPMTPEALLGAAPDAILTTTQGIEALGGIGALLARPGMPTTPAGRNGHVVALDALYLMGFGPRLPEAVAELARRCYGPPRA